MPFVRRHDLDDELTNKGQTTIPKDVRKRLNLQPGDRLELEADARVVIPPASVDVPDLNINVKVDLVTQTG